MLLGFRRQDRLVRCAWLALCAMLLAACMPAIGQWQAALHGEHAELAMHGEHPHRQQPQHAHAGHACGYCVLQAELPVLPAPVFAASPALAVALQMLRTPALPAPPLFALRARARAPPVRPGVAAAQAARHPG